MSPADLPPIPDPHSGEPRPPRAPVENPDKEPEAKQPFQSRKVLKGPTGGGPALEWHYGDRSMQRWMSGILVAVCLIFATLKWGGLGWMSVWWLWLILAGIGLLGWILPQGHKIAAGSDWLNTRGGIVRIYELTEIKVTVNAAGGYGIELRDRSGGEADTSLDFMHSNRDLWDLVYNGIRHSVASGASTNAMARSKLKLGNTGSIREHSD
ncbi:hypothetical protein [Amycolatopsis anabasis]|uniref:hypothetical protein n=1 Tax=Amycolatopsis anabasis TaxID=1840409 RepID=UPI00131C6D36|nr:hypothetical protein [Amycolatopsis anabasis]